mmetsp:Transcript_22914/g.40980  ORF Transcript_22914/g.40980 Transcript_22914/m.40980 type:complete len:436 (+) Transcript_22914:106-1413(+)
MSGYGSSDLNPMFPQAFSLSQQGEGDPWPQQRIYGDFYREPVECVTRGVTLPGPSLGVHAADPSADGFKDFVPGDYYRDQDDVFKGVTIAPSFPTGLGDFDWGLHSSKGVDSQYEIGTGPISFSANAERFHQSDRPPAVPTDSFFKFEVTTLHVTCQEPHSIGNQLLDFLGCKVVSSVEKVNRKKFAIKADVFVDSVMCTLKIRTYSQGKNMYAIEFQRRSGDCVTFNNAYQQALKVLKVHFQMVSNGKEEPLGAHPPGQKRRRGKSSEAEISPLLDMASIPGLQAESATALADMAQDSLVAASLCTASAFKEFKKLLEADNNDVAYPTARMLSMLALCLEAAPHFVEQGFLPIMIEKVRSKATNVLVQRQLSQVLSSAAHRCAGMLGETDRFLVRQELTAAMEDMGNTSDICQNLKEALSSLRYQLAAGGAGWH